MKILPFVIIGLVGLTALGASIYLMKGSAPQPQVAETDVTSPPPAPPPPPPHPFAPSADTADQNTPPAPAQTVAAPSSVPPGNGQPWPPGQGGGRMQRFYDQLGLTDTQKQQIAQIRQTVTDRQQRRDAIRAVLTPDQQTKFDQMRAQFRNRNGGGPGGPGNQGGPGADGNNNQQNGNPTAPPVPAPGT